jgi:signal transduction histidine kinase
MVKKIFKKLKDDKKYFTVVFFILILIIISGIITPLIINQQRSNWDSELTYQVAEIEKSVKTLFSKKELRLLATKNWLKRSLSETFKSKSYEYKELIELVNHAEKKEYSLEVIAPNGKLIAWNENIATPQEEIFPLAYPLGETYFYRDGLLTYLTIVDTVLIQNDIFYLIVSEEIEKHYTLQNEFYSDKSFSKEISEKFLTRFIIDYDPFAPPKKDGRMYSFPVVNYRGTKIGQISLYKPSLNVTINSIRNVTTKIQSALVVIVCIFIGLGFRREFVRIKYKSLRFLLLVIYLTAFRILIFIVEFPSMFLSGSIANPANFSSTFAWGLVKSPIEFFITNLFAVIIGIQLFRYCFQYLQSEKTNRWWFLNILSVPALIITFFFLLRGLSAAIKSVIFDSTIRYFKDPTPVPDTDILFMNLNVLMFGLSIILVMTALTMVIGIFLKITSPKYELIKFSIYFISIQTLAYYFFDYLPEPLITYPMVFLFISLILLLLYFVYNRRQSMSQSLLYGTVISSVIVVILMNFFNLHLERQSLKTVAFEIMRANENLLHYMSDETLNKALEDDELMNSFFRSNINYDAEAFRVWSDSPMQKESKSSGIFLFDKDKREIGSFSVGLEKQYNIFNYFDVIELNETNIIEAADSIGGDVITYVGVIPVVKRDIVSGYVAAVTEFNIRNIGSKNIPDFLKSNKALLGAAIDASLLKIFEFTNERLTQVYGDIYPSREQMIPIYNANFSEFNDAWINFSIYDENYVAYVIKLFENDDERVITVAAKEKEITWNLFNFFKIFFLHTIFILLLFISLIVTKLIKVQSSFRIRLLYAFLLVSIVPLGLLAVYNREVVSERSEKAIFTELSKRSDYLENHITSQLAKHKDRKLTTAFRNAGKELDISFAVYQNTDLLYSSRDELYRTGLFNYKLNSKAHYSLNYLSYRKYLTNENIDRYTFDAYYRKINVNNVPLIIGVNDAFNKIKPAFSSADIDVILFGIYSFALIIIIFVSTVLANQISAPIRRLTKATEAVAKGDLDVELENNEKGEMNDLYQGFNLMTKELQKNQIELAELERESAWKEMAKQVAHEIKNPLTPIKLAVQQLIASHKDNSKDFDKIFKKVTKTTLNQIDNLGQIASEFSSFAKMPSIKLEKLDVVPVIKDTTNLFTDDKINIDFENEVSEAIVEADTSQLRRMLINMIRNSIQANATDITIRLTTKDDNYSLIIVDNGEGISDENREKIFEINFTTKEKGMGLGLKLARRFLEGVNGNIHLVESGSSGTAFEIVIPKYNSSENV